MINIIVKNSNCQLKDVSLSAEELIKKLLTYIDSSKNYAYQKNIKAIRQVNFLLDRKGVSPEDQQKLQGELRKLLFLNKKLQAERKICLYNHTKFGTGLLPRVVEFLKKKEIEFTLTDLRKKPTLNTTQLVNKESFPAFRHYQKKANAAFLEHGRGIIVSPTGTGKTVMLMKMIWELGVPTLIVAPNKNITKLIYNDLVKYFGKGKVAQIKTKGNKLKAVNVGNIQALSKITAKELQGIQAVFIDEFHHAAATTYRELNEKLDDCYFRIGLTATPFRNDGSDLALESVLSRVIFTYDVPTAIKEGFLVKPKFRVVENYNNAVGKYQSQYKKGIVENQERNTLIARLAKEYAKESTIILVQQVEHGKLIKELLPHATYINGLEKDHIIEKALEDFRIGKTKLLIGTSVIGEGVDLPLAKILIMAGAGKARSQIIQNIGRVLRIYPGKNEAIVVDFEDVGAKYLEKHGTERREVYATYP